MKSRHAVKQGLRCLHGVVCLKLWIHYSSNLVKRQQLRERGQEPIKTEYSRQGRFQQGNKLKVKANEKQITNLHCNLKHPFTVVFDKVDKVLEANYLGWAFGTDIYQ